MIFQNLCYFDDRDSSERNVLIMDMILSYDIVRRLFFYYSSSKEGDRSMMYDGNMRSRN